MIINNAMEIKKRIRMEHSKCNLKIYESPALKIVNEGFGPSIMASEYTKGLYNDFVNKMENNFDDKLLTTMHNNCSQLIINETPFVGLTKSIKRIIRGGTIGIAAGYYNSLQNKVNVNSLCHNKKYKFVINHELLHMSSSRIKGLEIYNGFAQRIGNISIGNGINEGYTELLNEKYFGGFNVQPNYLFLKEAVRLVEEIVGSPRMEKFYFENDLKELRDSLALYTTFDSANGFIIDTDLSILKLNNYERIINYLCNLYDSKIHHEYNLGLISTEEYNRLYKFLNKEIDLMTSIVKSSNNPKQYIKKFKEGRR